MGCVTAAKQPGGRADWAKRFQLPRRQGKSRDVVDGQISCFPPLIGSSGCYFDELTGNGALDRLALLALLLWINVFRLGDPDSAGNG